MAHAEEYTLAVTTSEAGTRLDKYLCLPPGGSLSHTAPAPHPRGDTSSSHTVLQPPAIGCREATGSLLWVPPPQPARPAAEEIPLQIVYEDDSVLVLNKPPGLVVHPAPGHRSGTLVNALLFHCQTLSGVGGEARPGIVHRLDKDTSGLLLVAKHDRSHRHLAAQLKARQLRRCYMALVRGAMPASRGTIDAPIGRHPQRRKWRLSPPVAGWHGTISGAGRLGTDQPAARVTGDWRTHQIRVHLAHVGHAVLGDAVYGAGRGISQDTPAWNVQCGLSHAKRCMPNRCVSSIRTLTNG